MWCLRFPWPDPYSQSQHEALAPPLRTSLLNVIGAARMRLLPAPATRAGNADIRLRRRSSWDPDGSFLSLSCPRPDRKQRHQATKRALLALLGLASGAWEGGQLQHGRVLAFAQSRE